jgi:hypothetical protein
LWIPALGFGGRGIPALEIPALEIPALEIPALRAAKVAGVTGPVVLAGAGASAGGIGVTDGAGRRQDGRRRRDGSGASRRPTIDRTTAPGLRRLVLILIVAIRRYSGTRSATRSRYFASRSGPANSGRTVLPLVRRIPSAALISR